MISFTPTHEQQLIIETVRRYANERVRPAAHDADESGTTPPEIIATGWELGLLPSAIVLMNTATGGRRISGK